MAKPEGEIESYLKKQAEQNGYMCLKFVSPGNNGVPDRLLLGYGMTVFIETKAPGEKPRKLQKSVMANMRMHGADVRVIDTKEKIDQFFAELAKKNRKKPQAKEGSRLRGCMRTGSVIQNSDPSTDDEDGENG